MKKHFKEFPKNNIDLQKPLLSLFSLTSIRFININALIYMLISFIFLPYFSYINFYFLVIGFFAYSFGFNYFLIKWLTNNFVYSLPYYIKNKDYFIYGFKYKSISRRLWFLNATFSLVYFCFFYSIFIDINEKDFVFNLNDLDPFFLIFTVFYLFGYVFKLITDFYFYEDLKHEIIFYCVDIDFFKNELFKKDI